MPREPRRIHLRRDDRCSGCARELAVGVLAVWDPAARAVRCIECDGSGAAMPSPSLASDAGSSAHREYERRRARREAATRERWGPFGSIAVALSEAPASERAWETGSEGEVKLAGKLERWTSKAGVLLLHDRRMPRSRANVDHIAVGPSGVFVIDAKRYAGRIAVRGRPPRLVVKGRDCTRLVDGLRRQVAAVESIVGDQVSVRGVLCFVDGNWPLFGTLRVGDVGVLPPHKAARLCCQPGEIADEQRRALALRLASAFVPA